MCQITHHYHSFTSLRQLNSHIQKNKKFENTKRTIIIIEEAHNYVPSVKTTLCKEAIVRLAREGRKHMLSLCLVTQRPRNFDQTAFSQTGNKFIFALPHIDDVRHVLDDATYYSNDMLSHIQRQRVGECIINGDAFYGFFSLKVLLYKSE